MSLKGYTEQMHLCISEINKDWELISAKSHGKINIKEKEILKLQIVNLWAQKYNLKVCNVTMIIYGQWK